MYAVAFDSNSAHYPELESNATADIKQAHTTNNWPISISNMKFTVISMQGCSIVPTLIVSFTDSQYKTIGEPGTFSYFTMSTVDTVFHCMSATHCREQHEQSYQASACFIYTAFAPIGSIITAATRVCQWSVVKGVQPWSPFLEL